MFKIWVSRLSREKVTIEKMIRLFCKSNHHDIYSLCHECLSLLHYAHGRIDNCPFSIEKPICNICPIHCFKKDMREKVRKVMLFSGPRMFWKHPILALFHIFDKVKEVPKIRVKNNKKGC